MERSVRKIDRTEEDNEKKKKKKAMSIFPSWILWSIGLRKLVTREFIY